MDHSEIDPDFVQWNKTKETIYKRLTEGFLSSEQRFQQGVFSAGVSSEEDLAKGGGDQVFTRVVTDNLKDKPIVDYPFYGVVQILLDVKKAAKRVPYGYSTDEFGIRNPHHKQYKRYQTRESPVDYAAQAEKPQNEMMLKNGVTPDHIVALVVDSDWRKQDLIQFLQDKGLTHIPEIHVRSNDQSFTKEMWG